MTLDQVCYSHLCSHFLCRTTGAIKKLNMQNTSMKIGSEWGYYTSFDHDLDAPDEPNNNRQNSGAYIFRPSTTDQKPIILKQISATFYNTTAGTEVHAQFEVPWIKTVTRVMNGQPFLEVSFPTLMFAMTRYSFSLTLVVFK